MPMPETPMHHALSPLKETLALSFHVTRRNWAVYRKDFLANISPTVADPAFYIVSLGLGLGAFITSIDGHSYIEFLAPGLAVSTALLTSFFETSYGFYVRMTYENIYKAMLTTPIGVNEVIFGEYLWVALKAMGMTVVTTLVFSLFGLVHSFWAFPLMALTGILIGLSCGAIGLIASAKVRNINQFQTIYSFFISPLFFFAGIFFPLHKMPVAAQWVAYALPLAHGVDLAHAVYWNDNIPRAFALHGSVLVVQSAVLCWIAFALLRKKLRT
jgi:lipooligosaccharide transport system permease protein